MQCSVVKDVKLSYEMIGEREGVTTYFESCGKSISSFDQC